MVFDHEVVLTHNFMAKTGAKGLLNLLRFEQGTRKNLSIVFHMHQAHLTSICEWPIKDYTLKKKSILTIEMFKKE